MSFKFFRKHQKVMLWFVVVITIFTFSIFSITSTMQACFRRGSTDVGEFVLPDGSRHTISLERLNEVRYFLPRLNRGYFSPEQVTIHLVLYEEAQRAGIKISDQQLQEGIKSYLGGGFTAEQYRQITRNYFDFPSPRTFEEAHREKMAVSLLKYMYDLEDEWYLTEDIYEEYKVENEEFTVDYVAFSAADHAGEIERDAVTDEDLQAQYNRVRNGPGMEEYFIPEKFTFDFAYLDLAGLDPESYADLTADVEVSEQDVNSHYFRVRERYRIEDEEPPPPEEPGDGAEDPAGETGGETPEGEEPDPGDDEPAPETKYRDLEEVRAELEKELKVIALVDKAHDEWVQFVEEHGLIKDEEPETPPAVPEEGEDVPEGEQKDDPEEGEGAGEGEEPGEAVEQPVEEEVDADAFFEELCNKYRLSFKRIDEQQAFDTLNELELFGCDEFKNRVRMLRANESVVIKPGTGMENLAYLTRVTGWEESQKLPLAEVREKVLDDYVKSQTLLKAHETAKEFRDALKERARELEDLKPEIDRIMADGEAAGEKLVEEKSADENFTDEQAQTIRDNEKRKAESQVQRFLEKHLYRVFEDVAAEKGLAVALIDTYPKSVMRDPAALEELEGAEKYIKTYSPLSRQEKNSVTFPLRDTENECIYVARIKDRTFPPPERMTQQDVEDGKRRLEMNRMIEKFQAQQQGKSLDDDRFSIEAVMARYRVKFYGDEGPEE